MTELEQDLALAVRRLARTPGLTVLVIVTLAVGIGITTAVFALVHAVALRPLPFPDPGRLMVPWVVHLDGTRTGISLPDFLDLQAKNRTFDHLGFYSLDHFTLRGADGMERIPGVWVSAGYFPSLGVQPAAGRLFTEAEADGPGAPVVLVGHDLWQRRLGGDPRALGSTLVLNQVPLRIVGILPPDFRGLDGAAEVYVPLALFDRLIPSLRHLNLLRDRNLGWGRMVSRLAPGAVQEEALADLRTIAGEEDSGQLALTEARRFLAGDLRPQLLRLLGAASFVLLICCANVGHLLLNRTVGRHREMAVRAALGATRARLVRHGWLEGLLLGCAGGAGGLLTAAWSLDLLLAVLPLEIPVAFRIGIGGAVVAFALGLALLGGGLTALAPALHLSRPDLPGGLKQGGRGASESPASRRTRFVLVTADVALALMLLIGAGLMTRSLDHIRHVDPGFQSRGVLTLSFEPPTQVDDAERVRIKREVLERVARLPGVRGAALTSHIFFDPQRKLTVDVVAEWIPASTLVHAQLYFVSSGLFRTLGIPLEAGRDFSPADHRQPARAAVVNRAFVDLHLPPGDPLGRRFALRTEPETLIEVIGVVGDVHTSIEPGKPARIPQVYLPSLESPTWGFNLVIAAEEDAASLLAPVRQAIHQVSPETALFNVAPLEARVGDATADTRFFTGLMTVFAGSALALAVLGIYSLIVSMVQREARDLAVRRVLGAGPWEILRLVLTRGLAPTLLGIALGLAGAFVLARTLSALLFDVAPLDPVTFLVMPLLFALAAFAACLLPAQRAVEIEPRAALRDEG